MYRDAWSAIAIKAAPGTSGDGALRHRHFQVAERLWRVDVLLQTVIQSLARLSEGERRADRLGYHVECLRQCCRCCYADIFSMTMPASRSGQATAALAFCAQQADDDTWQGYAALSVALAQARLVVVQLQRQGRDSDDACRRALVRLCDYLQQVARDFSTCLHGSIAQASAPCSR